MSLPSGPQERHTKLVAGLAAAVLLGLVGLVLFSLVSLMVVVFYSASQQALCSNVTLDAAGNGSVPLPAENPAARLQVSVASWNTFYGNSVANVVRGVGEIERAGGDVVGLQEQNNQAKFRALQRRLAGTWAFTGAETKTPIGWRASDYQLLAHGSVKVFGPSRMEDGVAGTRIGTKHVVWAELRDVHTRATFVVVNDHKVPSAERSGHPAKNAPLRVSLWHRQDQAVGAVIARLKPLGVPIFKTGDENLNAKTDAKVRDPGFAYVQMQKRGLYSNWRVLGYPKHGTHGGSRLIDYVWATTRLAAPVRQRILGRYGSDHSVVLVDLDNRKAAVAAHTQQTTNADAAVLEQANRAVAGGEAVGGSTRRKQIANAKLVEEGVRAAGGSGRAVYLALVAAVGESDLINIDYGDKAGPDSRGLFQQRTNWGTLAQRMNPVWAAGAFMLGPHQAGRGGLLQLKGWDQMPVTLAIHRVQINADPNHYSKFESRAAEIGRQASINFDAPAGHVGPAAVEMPDCPAGPAADLGLAGIGSGPCPLDRLHAPGKANPRDCNAALAFLTKEMTDGSHAWSRACMALVAVAYGWRYSGNDTAFIGAQRVIAAGQMHTTRTGIAKGAVLWWDGRRTGNEAGHVAVYDGNGYILSNDVTGPGTVGRVPWTFPEDRWGQRFIGWSAPYLPRAG